MAQKTCLDNKGGEKLSGWRKSAAFPTILLLTACSAGGDSDQSSITPLTTPMAFVVNQDDTTLTTVRLDGKGAPVISTLSLGPAQADSIGGVGISLGEWVFVPNTNTNKVAAVDPIGGPKPILEEFLDVNGPVRLGRRPTRIYRDPVDKEVLLTMNEGDPVTGLDTIRGCPRGGSVTALHNSHLSAGGDKPRVTTTVCLSGVGRHEVAFSLPTASAPNRKEVAFVTSQTTGIISPLLADPSNNEVRWSEFTPGVINLCNSAKEQQLGFTVCNVSQTAPNHSAPTGIYWSRTTEKIYSHLSGYQSVVEIDPDAFPLVPGRTVDTGAFQSAAITPNGRYLILFGVDLGSDPNKVKGKFGFIDLADPTLAMHSEQIDHIWPSQYRFTPDGTRLYLTLSNGLSVLTPQQAATVKKDKLMVFDTATLPFSLRLVSEIDLPAVGPLGDHGLDVWVTGPKGAGSAKGIVVTNAPHGGNGSVSLIDAATNTIATTIPVGRNPRLVTVYYAGLVASDNQATPTQ
jgi:YVTN family beta-propeller protein